MDFFEQNSFRHSSERWKGFKTSLVDFHIREKFLDGAKNLK
jgi:hypothetical protein